MEQKVIVKFHAKLGTTAEKTYEMMKEVYGNSCMSRANVLAWHTRFRECQEGFDEEKTASTPSLEIFLKVQETLDNNPSATAKSIAETLRIPRATVQMIIDEELECRRDPENQL
ncbi:hypothetical protein DMENIID0001_064520 [Sergentomyia squamirostris]